MDPSASSSAKFSPTPHPSVPQAQAQTQSTPLKRLFDFTVAHPKEATLALAASIAVGTGGNVLHETQIKTNESSRNRQIKIAEVVGKIETQFDEQYSNKEAIMVLRAHNVDDQEIIAHLQATKKNRLSPVGVYVINGRHEIIPVTKMESGQVVPLKGITHELIKLTKAQRETYVVENCVDADFQKVTERHPEILEELKPSYLAVKNTVRDARVLFKNAEDVSLKTFPDMNPTVHALLEPPATVTYRAKGKEEVFEGVDTALKSIDPPLLNYYNKMAALTKEPNALASSSSSEEGSSPPMASISSRFFCKNSDQSYCIGEPLPGREPSSGVDYQLIVGYGLIALGIALYGYAFYLYRKRHSSDHLEEGIQPARKVFTTESELLDILNKYHSKKLTLAETTILLNERFGFSKETSIIILNHI